MATIRNKTLDPVVADKIRVAAVEGKSIQDIQTWILHRDMTQDEIVEYKRAVAFRKGVEAARRQQEQQGHAIA